MYKFYFKTLLIQVSKMDNTSSELLNHVTKTHYISMYTYFYEVHIELASIQKDIDDQYKQYRMKERLITGEKLFNFETSCSKV